MSYEDKTLLNLTKLPTNKILPKTGTFINSATGAVWKLLVRDGELTIDMPNFSFQISPVSGTRFKPVNTQINLELEFEKALSTNPLLLHIYAKGIKRATFEAI